jgi:adenosine deaminase/adenosine deaminase CECR1
MSKKNISSLLGGCLLFAFQLVVCVGPAASAGPFRATENVAGVVPAKSRPATRQSEQITRRYYESLIAPTPPRLAELTLFTSLLPKGGDLHHHYSGAIYAETYLDWVAAKDFCIYTEDNAVLGVRQYSIETKLETRQPAARAICLGVEGVRKNNDFYRRLLTRWSDKDYDNHFHEQPPPDQQFFETFGYFGPISGHFYPEGLRALKARALAENVQYIETMLKSPPPLPQSGEIAARINGLARDAADPEIFAALAASTDAMTGNPQARQAVEDYARGIDEVAKGLDDENFKLRFQAYVSRNSEPATVFAGLYASFVAASSPAVGGKIVGVNIVGPENGHVALRDYGLHMKMFQFLKQRFPGVKLALHAGELTLGMVPPEDLRSHIAQAVRIAGANRIGHGIDIVHEANADQLLAELRARQIAIEVNLSSTEFILGVKNEAHPLILYRRHGIPLVISTDDAGVSRSNLSGEYLLYASRYRPSYPALKQTAYNSIRHSFLTEAEKREETARLDRRYTAFEARMAVLVRGER